MEHYHKVNKEKSSYIELTGTSFFLNVRILHSCVDNKHQGVKKHDDTHKATFICVIMV